MPTPPPLRIDGAVQNALEISFDDLEAIPQPERIDDVSRFHPKRKGDGVTLESVLRQVRPLPEATYLTLHAEKDDFHVSVPLLAVRGEGVLVYKLGGKPLESADGGPYRFLIRDPAACHTAELDDCANVKYVSRIELSVGKGLDTRPSTDDEHAELHAKENG